MIKVLDGLEWQTYHSLADYHFIYQEMLVKVPYNFFLTPEEQKEQDKLELQFTKFIAKGLAKMAQQRRRA